MINWAPLILAVIMIFFLERPGEKESPIVSVLIYFVLGIFPLSILGYTFPLGLPGAVMLLVKRPENKWFKVAAALIGAGAGWIYFTWFRIPGA